MIPRKEKKKRGPGTSTLQVYKVIYRYLINTFSAKNPTEFNTSETLSRSDIAPMDPRCVFLQDICTNNIYLIYCFVNNGVISLYDPVNLTVVIPASLISLTCVNIEYLRIDL